VGYVHTRANEKERWGDFVAELEWGYASGDPDPLDGETNRFTFDTSHNVGLVLFDHVLAWKTARAATIAQDERIVGRPNPGLQFLPSNGGVFGATYLNPRFIFRPLRMVDVKLGFLWGQPRPVVDPYHVGALGDYQNYDGGDPHLARPGRRDRRRRRRAHPARANRGAELGVEGGVLFPVTRSTMAVGGLSNQLLNTKVGLQF
jgi:hypothetical protein